MDITVITASIPERQRMLAETIESVQVQTSPVDAHLVRVQRPPQGLLSPRHVAMQHNALLKAVDTEWVATLNDDDIYHPDHVEKIRSHLGPDVDVVYSWPTNEYDWFRIDVSDWTSREVADRLEEGNFIREAITVRTELLRQLGGWGGEYQDGVFSETGVEWEDWDLLIRLARAGARFRCVPLETWDYRAGQWRAVLSWEKDEPPAFEVLAARYGIDGALSDVTHWVSAYVTNGRLAFRASNNALGGDPAVGRAKYLHLTFSVDGEVRERQFREGSWVELP
jgi:hypothetical protein